MNLCFSTLGCPDWTFDRVVSEAQKMGFQSIEVRGIKDALRLGEIEAFKPEHQPRTQAMLDEAGIRIRALGTSATLHDVSSLPQALSEVREALCIANRMGIPAVRVFGDSRPTDDASALPWHHVAEGLQAMCAVASDLGQAQVWLEVHGAVNTVEILTPILNHVGGHPSFGLIWDIQHSYRAAGNDIDAFYQLVRPYTKHMHIKDGKEVSGGFEITLPGEGEIDIQEIVNRLERDGYDGCYSFEWEKRWHRDLPEPEVAFPTYVQLMQRISTKPQW